MRRILVIEDHEATCQWWRSELPGLFPDSEVVVAGTLASARGLLQARHFWLAIVDINLPDGSGIELVSEISSDFPDMVSVVCTIFDDDRHVFAALRAGALGYLVKDEPRSRQLRQLGEILHGQPPLSPGVARRILRYLSDTPEPTRRRRKGTVVQASRLTDREVEVLSLIAKGHSRPEVARILGLSTNTVSTYTKTIYQKLNVSRRAEAVVEALRLGIIRPD